MLLNLRRAGVGITLPVAPDLAAFDEAFARATTDLKSEKFWRDSLKHIPKKIRGSVDHETFLIGWERKVDSIVLEEVRGRIKGTDMPRVLEVAAGFSIGYNELHGAPWLSRRLVQGLGTENVLVSTYNNLAALAAYREARLLLNQPFESSLFGLKTAQGVNFHRLEYLNKGTFDILYGRCLDPTTFSAERFQKSGVHILNPGGIAIMEIQWFTSTDILIFEHHPIEPRLSLRETR